MCDIFIVFYEKESGFKLFWKERLSSSFALLFVDILGIIVLIPVVLLRTLLKSKFVKRG